MSIGDIEVIANDVNVTVQQLPTAIIAINQGSQIKVIEVVPLSNNTAQVLADNINVVVKQVPANVVVTDSGAVKVVQVAGGPPGPPGPAGAGAAFIGIAGAVISGGIGCILQNGLIYPADPTNISHANLFVGISAGAAQETANVTILQAGLLQGESYLAPNAALYIGLNGILSVNKVAPGAAWQMRVGTTRDTSSMVIVLQPPIQQLGV